MEKDCILTGKFKFDGELLEDGPTWGMSLLKAGSMRFRWNEINHNRISFLNDLCGSEYFAVAPELTHSKTVFFVENPSDIEEKQGDGVVCINKTYVPCVTVADCMPIFLYDKESGAFGTLHSGWKGTGISENAINLLKEKFGIDVKNLCVVLGPHIHDCCYKVNEERANYFIQNFGENCIKKEMDGYALSLCKANINILKKIGIPEKNILSCEECTCCNEKFGSFRRENPIKGTFTVQIAWNKW